MVWQGYGPWVSAKLARVVSALRVGNHKYFAKVACVVRWCGVLHSSWLFQYKEVFGCPAWHLCHLGWGDQADESYVACKQILKDAANLVTISDQSKNKHECRRTRDGGRTNATAGKKSKIFSRKKWEEIKYRSRTGEGNILGGSGRAARSTKNSFGYGFCAHIRPVKRFAFHSVPLKGRHAAQISGQDLTYRNLTDTT